MVWRKVDLKIKTLRLKVSAKGNPRYDSKHLSTRTSMELNSGEVGSPCPTDTNMCYSSTAYQLTKPSSLKEFSFLDYE